MTRKSWDNEDSYYDYDNQCWVMYGFVQNCGHPSHMDCKCYGRIHAGEKHTKHENCH
jgi:hypothetical protein